MCLIRTSQKNSKKIHVSLGGNRVVTTGIFQNFRAYAAMSHGRDDRAVRVPSPGDTPCRRRYLPTFQWLEASILKDLALKFGFGRYTDVFHE
jgi:hypothetical protein